MVKNFRPQIWSSLLNKALEKNLVYASCTNSNYTGDIKKAGDVVKINEIGSITVSPYVRGTTTLTYEELSDASQLLTIDQSKSFSFKVEDADKWQSIAELIGPATDKASYAIRDTIDAFIASHYTDAGIITGLGTDAVPIAINKTNVAQYLVKMARLLDDNFVPREGRFIVVSPFMVEDLINANIILATDNTNLMANGLVTRYAGFDVKMSQNVPNTSKAKYKILAGVNSAITYAGQASEIEALRLEGSFSDAVRGLYLYGAKVVNPSHIACLTADEAAD